MPRGCPAGLGAGGIGHFRVPNIKTHFHNKGFALSLVLKAKLLELGNGLLTGALSENGESSCRFLVEKQQKRNKAGVSFKRVCERLEKRPNYCVSAAYTEIILAYLYISGLSNYP